MPDYSIFNTVSFHLRITDSTLFAYKCLAREARCSVSEALEVALERYLKDHKPLVHRALLKMQVGTLDREGVSNLIAQCAEEERLDMASDAIY